MAISISGLAKRNTVFSAGNAQAFLDIIDQELEAVGWHCPSNNHSDCSNDPTLKLIYATAILTSQEAFGGPGNGDVIIYDNIRIGWRDPVTPPPGFPADADSWVLLGTSDLESMQNMAAALPTNAVTQDGGIPGNIHITILPAAKATNGRNLGGTISGHVTWDQHYTYGGGYILWSLPMVTTAAQIQMQMTVTDYEHSTLSFIFSDASELITFTSPIFAPRMPASILQTAQIICSGWQFFLFLNADTAAQSCLLASLPARDLSLGKLIIVIGSDDGFQCLRTALYSAGKYWIKNGSDTETVIPPNSDPRVLQFVVPTIGSEAPVTPSLMGQALLTSDDGALPTEVFVAASLDGVSRAVVIGELWDSYIVTKDATLDQTGTIGGLNSQCVGSDPGSTTRTNGSFWMLVP